MRQSGVLPSTHQTAPLEENLLLDDPIDTSDVQRVIRPSQNLKYHGIKPRPVQANSPLSNGRTRQMHSKSPSAGNINVIRRPQVQLKSPKPGRYGLSERDYYSILNNSTQEGTPQNLLEEDNLEEPEEPIKRTFIRQKSRSRSFLKNEHQKSPKKEVSKLAQKMHNLKQNLNKKQADKGKQRSKSPVRSASRSIVEGRPKAIEVAVVRPKSPIKVKKEQEIEPVLARKNSRQPIDAIRPSPRYSHNEQEQQPKARPKSPIRQSVPHEEERLPFDSQYPTLHRSVSESYIHPRPLSRSIVKKKIKQFDTDLTFHPMLSKRSLQIASKLGRSADRLTKNLYRQPESDDESTAHRDQAKPKINKFSEQLANKAKVTKNIPEAKNQFERLYQFSRIYKQKNENLRIKKIEEELQKELIINKSKTPDRKRTPNKDGNEHFFTSEVDVSERNNMWQSKMKEKIQRMKGQQADMEVKDCTFQPQIEASKTSHKIHSAKNLVKTSEFMKEGLTDHFTRVEMAKQKKGYADMSRKKSPNATRELNESMNSVGQPIRKNSRLKTEGNEVIGIEKDEAIGVGRQGVGGMSQRWANSQAMVAPPKEDPEKQKMSAMLMNLKKLL